MAAKRTYTDEQLAYIKQHWRKYPTKLVAEQLGMTPCKVDNIANYHGLRKNLNKSRKPCIVIDRRKYAVELSKSLNFSLDDRYFNPKEYDHYQAVAAKHDAMAPRKNWLQRLVSWLLTGEA